MVGIKKKKTVSLIASLFILLIGLLSLESLVFYTGVVGAVISSILILVSIWKTFFKEKEQKELQKNKQEYWKKELKQQRETYENMRRFNK